MTVLHLGPGLDLPDSAGTETFGLLGNRGAGKSNAAAVMAEAMWDAGIPTVIIDPKGDWWGLRSAADGTPDGGLPIPIFGGLRADLPLEVGGGAYLADLIYERRITCLVDVSRLSKADRARLLVPFADQLYARHQAEPTVRHLIFEEAHEYLPQTVGREEGRLKEALTRIVLFGRSFGLGATLASQRSARLHNDVLTQIGTLIAMRTLAQVDRRAIQGWVTEHNVAVELVAALPSLQPGQAWLWSPSWLRRLEQVEFRRRRTFDSGATPALGAKAVTSPTLAELDLASIKEAMAESIARATEDDPATLRRRIAQLERDLAAARAAGGPDPAAVQALLGHADAVRDALGRVTDHIGAAETTVDMLRAAARTLTTSMPRPPPPPPPPAPRAPPAPPPAPPPAAPAPARPVRARPAAPAVADQAPPPPAVEAAGGLPPGANVRAVFAALAHHRGGLNRVQLALLSGYKIKSSSLTNALGALRSAGLVTRGTAATALTDAGAALAGALTLEPLPTGRALYEYWLGRLTDRAERIVLGHLVDAWPEPVTRSALAELSGYSATSSSLSNALGHLRSLKLVDGWRASDDLMEAINQ